MFQPIQRYQIAVKAVQELDDPLVQIWEEIPKDTIRHLIRGTHTSTQSPNRRITEYDFELLQWNFGKTY